MEESSQLMHSQPVLCSVLKEQPVLRMERQREVLRTSRPLCSGEASTLRVRPAELLENCIANTSIFVLPSYKKPTVDALAPSTDEGRGWPRKATGSCRPSVDPWMSEWGNPAPVMGCHSRLNL